DRAAGQLEAHAIDRGNITVNLPEPADFGGRGGGAGVQHTPARRTQCLSARVGGGARARVVLGRDRGAGAREPAAYLRRRQLSGLAALSAASGRATQAPRRGSRGPPALLLSLGTSIHAQGDAGAGMAQD